jgi:SAM-dependent methyltransferase
MESSEEWDKRFKEKGYVWGQGESPTALEALHYLKTKSKILDVGCGYGRDYKLFLEKGFEVVGLDSSGEAVKGGKTVAEDVEETLMKFWTDESKLLKRLFLMLIEKSLHNKQTVKLIEILTTRTVTMFQNKSDIEIYFRGEKSLDGLLEMSRVCRSYELSNWVWALLSKKNKKPII